MLLKTLSFLKKYWKQILLVVGTIFVVLKMQSCMKPPVQPSSPLPPGVDKQIIIKNGETIIKTKKEEKVIRGGRETVVSIKDDATINVKVKDVGIGIEPIFGAAVNATGPKLTLGAEFGYFKYMSALGGVGFDNQLKNTVGFIGVGVTPKLSFAKNTMIWVGCDTTKSPLGGLAWKW